MAKHVVAAVGDIPPGTRRLAQVNGRAIVVFNLGGEFFALSNRCPHRGGSLAHGIQTGLVQSQMPGCYDYSRVGEMVKCPWHGWVETQMCSRMYSDGAFFRCGTSPLSVFQLLSMRQPSDGIQPKPASIITILSSG